jgi:hydroxymethylpyrimidine pyrophosphatase-like HAD family hydrolase
MIILVDLDNTILYSEKNTCLKCNRDTYVLKDTDKKEIENINRLYDEGNLILIYTGRNWDCYWITKDQLNAAGVKHHELVMGKPAGIYFDKDAMTTLEGVK